MKQKESITAILENWAIYIMDRSKSVAAVAPFQLHNRVSLSFGMLTYEIFYEKGSSQDVEDILSASRRDDFCTNAANGWPKFMKFPLTLADLYVKCV